MRSFVFLLFPIFVIAAACSSEDGSSGADAEVRGDGIPVDGCCGAGDTTADETPSAGCSGLGQGECEASDECEPYLAWPEAVACASAEPSESPSFLGCGPMQACSQTWTWAAPEAQPDDWYQFINGCLPDGWVRSNLSPCE
jgi:hypothetical protein